MHIALDLLVFVADVATTACAYNSDLTEHLIHSATLSMGILGHPNRCGHLATSTKAAIEIWGIVVEQKLVFRLFVHLL